MTGIPRGARQITISASLHEWSPLKLHGAVKFCHLIITGEAK
jgi:hypothetical protein